MVRLVHLDVYHNMCIHGDGEDFPFCSELVAQVDDHWCFDIEKMDSWRNKKYEASICPSEVVWEVVKFIARIALGNTSSTKDKDSCLWLPNLLSANPPEASLLCLRHQPKGQELVVLVKGEESRFELR